MKVGKQGPGLEKVELILKNLTFVENFGGHETTLDIDAGATISLVNPFRPFIPSRFVLLDVQLRSAGTVSITRGSTAWGTSALNLKNSGTANATVTVVFLP